MTGITELSVEVMKEGLETASFNVNISGGTKISLFPSSTLSPFP